MKNEEKSLDTSSESVYFTYTMTGKGIRRARKKLGMTQTQLGQAIGMQKNTIARMERGELLVMRTTDLAVRYLLLVAESKTKGGHR